MINPYDLDYDLQEKLAKLFWTKKWGYLPTKVEKVGRKMTFEEDRIESELHYKEFTEFVNSYLNDPIFRAEFE